MGIKKCFTCKLNRENYCLCDYPRNKFLIRTNWNTENCPWYKKKEESIEELKEWVEGEIAIAEDQLKNASSNEEYDRVEAKKFTLERVLDRINFDISE